MPDPKKDEGKAEDTIVIDAPTEETPEEVVTVKDAEKAELDPREIEAGKTLGVFVEDGKKGHSTQEPDKNKEDDEAKKNGHRDEKPPEKKPDPKAQGKRRDAAPWEKDVSLEEREQVDQFSPNEKALYWNQKKEKYRRQQAEAERDQLRAQVKYFQGKSEALEKVKTEIPPTKKEEGETDDDFLDEYGERSNDLGKPKDGKDKDKPLTEADLERREKEKEEKARKEHQAIEARRQEAIKVLDQQEAEFREDNSDFGEVYDNFTMDIVNADAKKLNELFPRKHEREGVKKMIVDWLMRLREPEKFTGEESAAALAYEIGKLHPKFSDGHSTEGGDADDDQDAGGEEDGDSTDESGEQGSEGSDDDEKPSLEKRLAGQRRPSSAPLNGGSNRRPKSVRDLTVEDLAMMSVDQIRALKKKHPNEVERILREG